MRIFVGHISSIDKREADRLQQELVSDCLKKDFANQSYPKSYGSNVRRKKSISKFM